MDRRGISAVIYAFMWDGPLGRGGGRYGPLGQDGGLASVHGAGLVHLIIIFVVMYKYGPEGQGSGQPLATFILRLLFGAWGFFCERFVWKH